MQRVVVFCLTFGVLGLAYSFAQQNEEESAPKDISELQKERIQLLETRASHFASLVEVGLGDRSDTIRARMDVLEVRLEYAQSETEKRKLLTDLITEYDRLIEFAELSADAPVRTPSPGKSSATAHIHLASELLLLKADRLRFEIALAELPAN